MEGLRHTFFFGFNVSLTQILTKKIVFIQALNKVYKY